MGLFKKKTDYSYYSSYSSSRRRLKVGRTVIAVIAAVIVILGIIIYFNFSVNLNFVCCHVSHFLLLCLHIIFIKWIDWHLDRYSFYDLESIFI